jgi:signal transduction histidine kinase
MGCIALGVRIWVASSRGGLARIDDPDSDRPQFTTYTTADGLSSDEVYCVVEDRYGRIYAGTARGVDRIEVGTGRIRRYTSSDGLASGEVRTAFSDQEGNLWFRSDSVARLAPEPEDQEPAPPVLIAQLRIAGALFPVSDLGEDNIANLELEPGQKDLRIDFVAPTCGLGEAIRYQYWLEGVERDWSAPTDQRAVNYASLSPGSYVFKVRAVNAEGLYSTAPATVSFTLRPPIWRRAWFLALVCLAAGLGVYALYRLRVSQLIEVERVRTRIATDLHDDIGASLSRIAILGEALKTKNGGKGDQPDPLLNQITESARDLADDVADVIWSIDPRLNDLSDLILRIRRFAADIFEARGIDCDFQTPPDGPSLRLTPEQRRQAYLILKEAINNIAHHASCSAAWIVIAIHDRQLRLHISDDGCGFAPAMAHREGRTRGGRGLENMRARAARLGGDCLIQSAPGSGTSVEVTIPLKRDGINMLHRPGRKSA